MLILLGAFALVPMLLPWLVARIGARAFYVGALLPIAAFVHTAIQTPAVLAGDIPFESFDWIPPLGIELSMRLDTLSWVMALIVTGVGALVLLYCRWYFRGKAEGVGQFSAVLLAFAGAMYGLVVTDDLVVLVMFWELTSVLSYLLIGFYNRRGASRRAALQALLVTSLGGLVMLIGVVLMVVDTGTSSISQILDAAPTGAVVDAALVLILVGALSKSAIFPFHFWLPGAMAAPTPVSAYLHAAAMVKAGIYLIALFAPVFAGSPLWRPIVIGLGAFTMLLGGLQALRETDLKRILAFGTVSQLGLLTVVLGYGTQDAALAGLALLISHALFKSALFLVVGVIDRQLSTRDIGELSGVGRQAPVMATFSIIAVASMVGVIPTIGFVAKEGLLTAFLHEAEGGAVWGIVGLVGIVLGSVLTAAYGIRFVWGAFWTKKSDAVAVERTEWPDPPLGFLGAPVLLSGLTIVAGFAAPLLDIVLAPYAELAPASTPGVAAPESPAHLVLWHGFEPALWISLGTIVVGAGLFWLTTSKGWTRRMLPFTAADVYNGALRGIARLSVVTTSFTQRGSLPVYVGTIFVVFVAAEGTALLAGNEWQAQLDAYQTPMQLVVAPIMIAAGLVAVRAQQALHGGRARLGHGPGHGAAVRHERRTRPGAHADPRRDGDPGRVRARPAPHPVADGRAQRLGLARRARRAGSGGRRDDGLRRDRRDRGPVGQADLGVVPRPRLRARPRQERGQRRARRPARLGHDGRAVGADPRGDGCRVARVRDPPRRHAVALDRSAAPLCRTHASPARRDRRRGSPARRGVGHPAHGVARRRSARAAREPLDPARGDRADSVPLDHHRVALRALRRPQPARWRIRGRARSRAWRWSCATSPAAATNSAPPPRPTPGAFSASACRSRSRVRSCRSCSVHRR